MQHNNDKNVQQTITTRKAKHVLEGRLSHPLPGAVPAWAPGAAGAPGAPGDVRRGWCQYREEGATARRTAKALEVVVPRKKQTI